MTKREKRLKKIRQNPKNVPFDDLRMLLEDYGFELRRTRGSHHSFVGSIGGEKVTLVIPYNKPLNPVYVNKALGFIEQIEASTDDQISEVDDDASDPE
jgi:predicted RNA binding protein YcfA (HicA-like mRNA interferase family)